MTEEMQLLTAFINAVGYEVHHVNGEYSVVKSAKKAKAPRKAKAEAYTEDFELCWSKYPSRPGNNKQDAFKCFQHRLKDGVTSDYLMGRTLDYKDHCDSEEKTGTNFVLQASTFYGCSRRFDDHWPVAEKKKQDEPWAKIPFENGDIEKFCKEHGYKMAGAGKTYPDWRRAIKLEIENKINEG